MIVCNFPVSQKKDQSYFEIEMEQIKESTADGGIVGIGFLSEKKIK